MSRERWAGMAEKWGLLPPVEKRALIAADRWETVSSVDSAVELVVTRRVSICFISEVGRKSARELEPMSLGVSLIRGETREPVPKLRKLVGCMGVSIGKEDNPPGRARRGLGATGRSCLSRVSIRRVRDDLSSSCTVDGSDSVSSWTMEDSDTLLLILFQVLLTDPHQPEPEDDSEVSLSRCTSTWVGREVASPVRVFFTTGDAGPGTAVEGPRRAEGIKSAWDSADLRRALRCNLPIRIARSGLVRISR